ncbi:hypothetical protein jhhlp_003770 [Lomentospora prolificans]|uniref:lytic cellulose monooxygenase (C4-dehydrogenating) n=1 Tax=Lomentospora prolificans TaxID=41688 RepID=A0A2N3N9N2_9PEZI|nr:hypothetical protein jhhlp_003770 [Lomentospora prolificans]
MLTPLFLVFPFFLTLIYGHYVFDSLILDGKPTGQWEYVRMTDNHYSNAPVVDVTSPEIRCYQAVNDGSSTSTANVTAGATIGFTSSPAAYHPGPLSFYMAKAPDGVSAAEFNGSGDVWFKIFQDKPTITASSIDWPNTGKSQLGVKIPTCLPDGDYLLRIEQVGLHSASSLGGAQFYISCAQVRVTGGGSVDPHPLVSLPGAYEADDPGLVVNIYYPIPQTYTVPGPAVWSC